MDHSTRVATPPHLALISAHHSHHSAHAALCVRARYASYDALLSWSCKCVCIRLTNRREYTTFDTELSPMPYVWRIRLHAVSCEAFCGTAGTFCTAHAALARSCAACSRVAARGGSASRVVTRVVAVRCAVRRVDVLWTGEVHGSIISTCAGSQPRMAADTRRDTQ